MKVSVRRTWKNIFKAKAVGDTIYVLANLWLSDNEIKEILSQNIRWFDEHKGTKMPERQPFAEHGTKENYRINIDGQAKNNVKNGRLNNNIYGNLLVDDKHAVHVGQGRQGNGMRISNRQNHCVVDVENRAQGDGNRTSNFNFCDMFCGKELLYFGKIIAVNPSATARTRLDKDVLFIFDDAFAQKDTRIKAIKMFLKRSAKDLLTKQIATFGSCVSLCAEKIEFKELNGGWINCTEAAERTICADYRIVQLPENLQRYLIAHCFAHFGSADHDENFCRKLRYYIPYFTQCEEELSRYDFLLEI